MSREIKFRAWDKESSRMKYDFWIEASGYQMRDDNMAGFPRLNEKNYVLMQYIGLCDKNGVEIYEGDIVKIPQGNTDGTDYIEAVQYNQRLASFEIANNYYGLQETDIEVDEVEVIGNIYENPELLDVKEST